MNFIGSMSEISEATEVKDESSIGFSRVSLDKFDKLMGDDKVAVKKTDYALPLTPEERESKFNKLFDVGDFFKKSEVEGFKKNIESVASEANENRIDNSEQSDILSKRKPNSEYELNDDIYETDDNGDTYKKNGELLPDIDYIVNGNKYKTDEFGNKISCDSEPSYTEDGKRNMKEQKESGGEERQEKDDGGHIIAKILGGADGEENLVPMRRTINRGDYKKMENEMVKALQEGKEVSVHIDLEYEENSKRPSKIRAEYIIDGKKAVVEFDNEENSTELLNLLQNKISDEDYNNLSEEIDDMKDDGIDVSITSVKINCDEGGSPVKITVGMLDESTGNKSYKVYEPK